MPEPLIRILLFWGVVEIIMLLMRRPYPRRTQVSAMWAAGMMGLSEVGFAPRDSNYLLEFCVGAIQYGFIILLLYFVIAGVVDMWQRRA